MSRHHTQAAINMSHSSGTIHRFSGPEAEEFFLHCRPLCSGQNDIAAQTVSAYKLLEDTLRSEGGSLEHVVRETVFFRNIRKDLTIFQQTRRRALEKATQVDSYKPATILIEQPPLDEGMRLEISVYAVIPHSRQSPPSWEVRTTPPCACWGCSMIGARGFLLGGKKHLCTGNIYGSGGDAYEEAYRAFCSAEGLLSQEGLSFRDVVRTWIYLRHIERDYADFNRARRDFFQHRGVTLRPASTGIDGVPFPEEHNISLSFYAIQSTVPLHVEVMTTPTLNEAWMYGSEFSRGLKVVEANKVALYVSGTASVDEQGRTAHAGDFEAQVDRMLLNISTLLSSQNASFRDLVAATTYLKSSSQAPLLREILHDRGIEGFPNALVQASVCRPDLLCEMEVIAALPL